MKYYINKDKVYKKSSTREKLGLIMDDYNFCTTLLIFIYLIILILVLSS